MTHIFYDIASGSVRFTINEGAGELPPPDGMAVIEVAEAPDDLHGWKVINGEIALDDIGPAQEIAVAWANHAVGEKRTEFITSIPGQEMIYQAKEAEARAYLDDAAPDMDNYPLLEAEIGVTASSASELAALWIQMGKQWRDIAAVLECARLTAVNAIRAASDMDGIEAAKSALSNAISAIPPEEPPP